MLFVMLFVVFDICFVFGGRVAVDGLFVPLRCILFRFLIGLEAKYSVGRARAAPIHKNDTRATLHTPILNIMLLYVEAAACCCWAELHSIPVPARRSIKVPTCCVPRVVHKAVWLAFGQVLEDNILRRK